MSDNDARRQGVPAVRVGSGKEPAAAIASEDAGRELTDETLDEIAGGWVYHTEKTKYQPS